MWCHSTAFEVHPCLVLCCAGDLDPLLTGSSVSRALMPREQRVMGLNQTQASWVVLGVVELFAFALHKTHKTL